MSSLIEVFPEWYSGVGIFSELSKFEVPWSTNALDLDLEYFGNHSGNKCISPLVCKLLDEGVLSNDNRTRLASIIFSINGDNWKRLYEALQVEYNPVYNYFGDETKTILSSDTGTVSNTRKGTEGIASSGSDSLARTGDDKVVNSGNETNTKSGVETTVLSGSDTSAKTGTESAKGTNKNTKSSSGTNKDETKVDETVKNDLKDENSIYGFNSAKSSNSDELVRSNDTTTDTKTTTSHTLGEKVVDDGSTSDTTTYDTQDKITFGKTDTHTYDNVKDTIENNETSTTTHNTTDTTTYGKSDTHTYDLEDKETRNLTNESREEFHREGNYGVITSQEMLVQEFELRIKYRFFDVVFSDIDKTLALSIY